MSVASGNSFNGNTGDIVLELVDADNYTLRWDARMLPSGVYFYRLEANGRSFIKKMALLK